MEGRFNNLVSHDQFCATLLGPIQGVSASAPSALELSSDIYYVVWLSYYDRGVNANRGVKQMKTNSARDPLSLLNGRS